MQSEHWQHEPEDHDFPAAATYLSLLMAPAVAAQLVEGLKNADTVVYEAKDLLRASRLDLLGKDNAHVAKDFNKVKGGQLLSPVLLVRGDAAANTPLVVADGYHRICASYWIDENAPIPCRMVDLPR